MGQVSVPYWSGQWLQRPAVGLDDAGSACFSPLLVGSVVATICRMRSLCSRRSFSPLLVGSVVATRVVAVRSRSGDRFSPLLVGSVVATWDVIISFA